MTLKNYKTIMRLKLLILLLILPAWLIAGQLPVLQLSGYVSDLNGQQGISDQEVFIAIPGSGNILQSVVTDSQGFYSATLTPPVNQGVLLIYTTDCDLQVQKQLLSYHGSGSLQADFNICPFAFKQCTAAFSYTVNAQNSNLLHFTDLSTSKHHIIEREWSFGNGSYSGLPNPNHLFNDSGSYTVSLKILTADSCYAEYSQEITVFQSVLNFCNANYYAYQDTSTGLPNVYKFFDNSSASSPVVQWHWDFGNGNSSTLPNPVHQFMNYSNYPDTFVVKLSIVTLTGCSSSYSFPFIINPSAPCNAYFAVNDGSLNEILFTNQSQANTLITSWHWSFGEGNTSVTQHTQHTYPYPGYYPVTLKITTQNNCVSSYTRTVKVGNPSYHNLFGQAFSGSFPLLDTGVAYLYRTYPNNYIQPVDTLHFGQYGCFYFFQLIEGHYKIAIRPSQASTFFNTAAPTYFTDKLHWLDAGSVLLNANQMNTDIHLKTFVGLPGQGSISGAVFKNTGTGNTQNMPDVMIFLFDAARNPVRVAYSDSLGKFSFSGLALGSYQVYAEIAGKVTVPVTIHLDAANISQSGVYILVDSTSVTGRFSPESDASSSLKVYPIPASQTVTLALKTERAAEIQLTLFDLNGRAVLTENRRVMGGSNEISLTVSDISPGYYFVRIESELFAAPITRKLIISNAGR